MAAPKLADVYPLSPLQEGILFHSLYAPESGVYVEQLSAALAGPLDAAAFARAWERVIERHAVLRTAFVWKSQKRPLQAVQRAVALPLVREDWSDLAPGEREARFARFLETDRGRGFELARAPLMRLALLRFGETEHRLVWTSHHLLLDGWSLPLVLSEVLRFYAACAAGRELDLPVPRPYRDYIAWVERQDLEAAEAFFRRELAGFAEPTELALPRRLPEPAAGEGATGDQPAGEADDAKLSLGRAPYARLAELARRRRLTLNTLVQGAWAALLGRYAGADDVVFGTALSGRGIPLAGVESMVGLLINTLPVRARLDPRAEVGAWLAAFQERQAALQSYETVPLARIQGWSELPAGTPLIGSLFVFENYPSAMAAAAGPLALGEVRFRERTNYPLTAMATPAGEDLTLGLARDPAFFDAATAARLLGHWASLLAAMGEALDRGTPRLGDLPMLSEAERRQLTVGWNPPPAAGFVPVSLPARFAAQAARAPDAVALTLPSAGDGDLSDQNLSTQNLGDQNLSYGELARRARRLAAALARRGVGPESLVAVCLERSLDLVVALLGVLEAGGAYLPLDPAYPPERLAFMLADSGARVLVSTAEVAARLPPHGAEPATVDGDETAGEGSAALVAEPRPGQLAYVIYTSGSTGRPKGVGIAHGDVARLLASAAPLAGAGPDDIWTLFHSYAFDFSVWEMWGALAHGGRLVVVPEAVRRAPEDLLRLLAEERVTVLNQTPSAFAQLAPAVFASGEALPSLRLVIFAGEALDPAALRPWLERFGEERPRLVNSFGPTETTVLATWRPMGSADLATAASPIGRPLAHLAAYLVDRHGRLVPPGVPGELHVGGASLARGYLGRPELTAERFVPDGLGGELGARLYRTGDLARRRPDGELEFLGRTDRQVKIRGHRIELGEIEAALAACPDVRAAAVVVRERDGARRLVAYVAAPAARTASDLRARLARTLPEPMLPAAFVRLDALPLTPNGKVDWKALAALGLDEDAAETRAGAAERTAPRGPVEALLARLWAEVLRLPEVGIDDNFFSLGGDSILSLQVVARAGQAGCRITPRQLFEHPTVAALAAVAERVGTAAPAAAAAPEAVAGDVPLTPIQRWFLDAEPADPHHFNQALLLAVRPGALSPGGLPRAVAALLAHHDALRLRFRRAEGRWRQWSEAPGGAAGASPAARIDLSALPAERATAEVTAAASAAQGSLDLAAGPLLRALWLDLPAPPAGHARLFLAIHHLAVDAVSWRVILEDLATAWSQVDRGDSPLLPSKTSSFRRWAERLAERARRMEVEGEAAFWLAQAAPEGSLALGGDAAADIVASAASVAVELGAEETADLLRALPAAYGAGIADALIASLATALAAGAGPSDPAGAVRIDVEGHGREETDGSLDLARTVGWFTSLYPVRLAPGDDARPGAVLAAVRRQLAAVPAQSLGRGLGYGLLRYLSDHPAAAPLRALPPSPVSFNYLGQLDAALPAASPFAPADEPVGRAQSPRARRSHALAVGALVSAGRLRATFAYGAERVERAAVERLAACFLDNLRALAAHVRAVAEGREEPVESLPDQAPAQVPGDWPPGDSLAALSAAAKASDTALLPAGLADAYPLAPLQEGLLFHSLYAPGAGEYVEQLRATFEGDLDLAAFRAAWRQVVERTPILRTSFHSDGLARPLQAVHAHVEVAIVEEDWRDLAAPEQARRFADLSRRDRARGFHLACPPLMRWTLARTGERAWRFLWSHHHALLDGWSYTALVGDFAACYEALAAGREPALRARPPYRDFIAWLSRRDPAADDEFFRRYLSGFGDASTAPTPLAADRPAAPSAPALASSSFDLRLSVQETAALRAAARARGLTPNTLAQGAWALLLGRTAGEDDVVFGATVAGRPPELPGVESMLGLFINSLPVRVRLDEESPVAAWLAGLQAAQAELRQHEATPLVRIQGVSEVPRGTPLFESLLVFENYPQEAAIRGSALGRQITEVESIEQTHYPLTLAVVPGGDRLLLSLGYDRGRFDETTALRRLGHLRGLLAALAAALSADGATRLGEIGFLSAAERQQLVHEWSRLEESIACPATLAALWERQAARSPGALALEAAEGRWTYAELDGLARRLAGELSRSGIGPEVPVAVAADRSPLLAASFLAVEMAGGVYLPLDPGQPAARLAYQLQDAAAPLVLTGAPWAALAAEVVAAAGGDRHVLEIDLDALSRQPEPAPALCPAGPDHLAYILYTSGSTGEPKGVATAHGAAAAHLTGLAERWQMRAGDRLALLSAPGFDAALEEMLAPWTAGGAVVIPGPDLREPARLLAEVERLRLTVLDLPTALWHALVNELAATAPNAPAAPPRDLRLVTCGGEAMLGEAARRWAASPLGAVPLLNGYGPTEGTISATWRTVDDAAASGAVVPIGRPLAGRAVHVLDRAGRLLPAGAPGELYLSDPLLARGYLGRPDLTAASFVPDPFAARPGSRLYRTGDLVRRLADGDLEFLGRADGQVKVRGVRVELREVEAALAALPGVRDVAVVARDGPAGERALVAYYTVAAPGAAAPSPAGLRAALARRLPAAMLPLLVELPALPLTPNDKVDRRALAALPLGSAGAGDGSRGPHGPHGPIEEVLAVIWEEVLGRERVGAEDDFFALGGHSLLATQVVSRIRRALDADLPLRTLFEHPTVAGLAAEIERLRRSGGPAAAPPIRRQRRDGELPLSYSQERMWLFDRVSPGNTVFNVPLEMGLAGRLSAPALAAALREVVRRHEALRTVFAAAGGRPVQRIDPPWRPGLPRLPVIDLAGLPDAAAEGELARLAAREGEIPFDLARGPLLRAALARLAAERHVLLLTLHHIVSDGWSMGVLVQELTALYAAAVAGEPSPLAELPIQYADFALWQRAWLSGEVLERELAHATARLAGLPALALPTDRPNDRLPSAARYFRSGLLPLALAEPLVADLQALSRRQGASLFMTLLAALQALVHRHTGQDDFAIGAPVAGRDRAEIEGLIGFFVNTLVLRADAAGGPTFAALLARARAATLEAYEHQGLPFALVAEALGRRSAPLLEVRFLWQNYPKPETEVSGLAVEARGRQTTAGSTNYSLSLDLIETGREVMGHLSYNSSLWDDATAMRWRAHLAALLAGAAADPERRLGELPLLGEGERHQVLVEWGDGGEVVMSGGEPAPIGVWGEVRTAAPDGSRAVAGGSSERGRRARRRADGALDDGAETMEESAAAPTPVRASDAPPRRLDGPRRIELLSPAKRELLARRIRGEAGGVGKGGSGSVARGGGRAASPLLVDLQGDFQRRPRAAAAGRPPFFCVHAIGGAVLSYRELARHLGPEQPFYGIQAAGLAGGAAEDDLPAMAAAYAAAVEAAAPRGPYLVGGWSFGGVVAFEMARQMRARGRRVALVALLDSWAPSFAPDPAALGEADVVRLFLRDQAGLQGEDASWLGDEPPAADDAAAIEWLLRGAREAGLLKAALSSAQVRPLLDVYRANVRASAAYRPQPGDDRLSLFRPRSSPEPTNGWADLTSEPVDVHELDANHYTLLAPPAVADLAERLGAAIDRELGVAALRPASSG